MKRTYRVERLARKEEKAVIKRVFTLSIFSVILIIVLFTVGIPLLGRFADFLESVFPNKTKTTQEVVNIPPPTFDSLVANTNLQNITVSGFAASGNKVVIYLNDEVVGSEDVLNGKFEFKDLVLTNGENKIKAKTANDAGQTSDFSQEEIVNLDTQEPNLEITQPDEGQTFEQNNRIQVQGKTDKDAQVFANGFLANVDSMGIFVVSVPLVSGENELEVKAQDEAGNSKTIKVKVNFKQ